MAKIASVQASKILDSRGNDTIEVKVILDDGKFGVSSVPAGASVGSLEAFVITDIGKAIQNIQEIIAPQLIHQDPTDQAAIDQLMNELDGTENKQNLGGNAILAISMALARAGAAASLIPLYKHISNLYNPQYPNMQLPKPCFNIINGGKHADNNLPFQEFMVVPTAETSFEKKLLAGHKIFVALRDILQKMGHHTNVGDEGGFAPNLNSDEEAIELLVAAIQKAGFVPKEEVTLAIDVAATAILDLNAATYPLSPLEYYVKIFENYPLEILEDPFSENDWENWQALKIKLGNNVELCGDDLFTTNPQRLKMGIEKKAANCIVIKPNQIGTLSETLETVKLAKENKFNILVSHRSGETEDTFISDLAVAIGAQYIKSGAPNRGERIAKYNQLLRIERELKGI